MSDLEMFAQALEIGTLVFGISMAGVVIARFVSLVKEEFKDDSND